MPRRRANKSRQRTVSESLQEYGRGVAGGLMFSLPLLYTMEVWWAGFTAHPVRLLFYVLATFILLLGYNRYAGLRRDANLLEEMIDSVEEMGVGLLLSALILFLLGRLTMDMQADEIAGRIVIEAMTVAIGVSIGTAQLGGGGDDEGMEASAGDGPKQKDTGVEGADEQEIHFGGQMLLAACGAVLFAANLAPTEEIVIIAIETSWLKVLGLALLSLLLCALVLHYSEFTGAKEFVRRDGFSSVLLSTMLTYAVALVSSALILWFFGRFDNVTLYTMITQTIVLGVAAALGASAGRLLLQ